MRASEEDRKGGVIVPVNHGGIPPGSRSKDVVSIRAAANARSKGNLTELLLAWQRLKSAMLADTLKCTLIRFHKGAYAQFACRQGEF
jgi:hypothetical protein